MLRRLGDRIEAWVDRHSMGTVFLAYMAVFWTLAGVLALTMHLVWPVG